MKTYSLIKRQVINGITFDEPQKVCKSTAFVKNSYCYDIAINSITCISAKFAGNNDLFIQTN